MDKRKNRKLYGAAAIVLACSALGGVAMASGAPDAPNVGDGTGMLGIHWENRVTVPATGEEAIGTPGTITAPTPVWATPETAPPLVIEEMPDTGSGSTAG